ncbi:uncharacterized protein G2W53_029361 [Senna tora]|uniref:Uncharacterized protein n=1 Tax=Senna tora TaxID=362788 RepID=A0A834WAM9_9FABA|nr:uncharacterized protein G2W53_029361 [Senna tora]
MAKVPDPSIYKSGINEKMV